MCMLKSCSSSTPWLVLCNFWFCTFVFSLLSWITPEKQDEISRVKLSDGSEVLLCLASTKLICLKVGVNFPM